ncbi:FtsK/SpoIIIE domain-containing protein [Sediminibacillus massiliensis]|nr:FtsK/SpoIIIE domain-containing protein [Sediminibacillus massiliensis]
MSDKNKIEKIFEYTGTHVKGLNGNVKKCQFIRKAKMENGTEYVYRLPLGLPYKQLQHLNKNIGVFKDGLHKNVEVEFDGGMLHLYVYETDLPKKWEYKEVVPLLKNKWNIPIGKTHKGLVWHDFDQIPHMVVGGTTRYGKTVNLKGLMTSLILSNPHDVEFYIIDLKEKLEFGKYEKLKQVTQVAGNPKEAADMLEDLRKRIVKMMQAFGACGYTNITETNDNKRIFVIVDEANRLVPQNRHDKDKMFCQEMLELIACIAGGLGVRLIFCTQYPVSKTMPRDVKQNSDAKMCFRIQNKYASAVVLGEENGHAAELPDIRGRCMLVQGPNLLEMQVPYISDKTMNDLLVDYMKGARKDVTPDEAETGENTIEFIPIGDA